MPREKELKYWLDKAQECLYVPVGAEPPSLPFGIGFSPKTIWQLGDEQWYVYVEEALQCYKEAIAIDPSCKYAYFRIGLLNFDEGRIDEAIAAYQRAIEADPDDPAIYFALGNVYYEVDDKDKAKSYFEKALGINPYFMVGPCDLGIFPNVQIDGTDYFYYDDVEAVINAYQNTLFLCFPSYGGPLCNTIGELLISSALGLDEKDRVDRAIGFFKIGVSLDPGCEILYLQCANTYALSLKMPNEALSWYGRFLERPPTYDLITKGYEPASSLFEEFYCDQMVDFYLERRQFDKALSVCQGVVQVNPQNSQMWQRMINTYQKLKKYELALEACQKAIAANPQKVELYRLQGWVYMDMERGKEAVDAFAEARKLAPDNAKIVDEFWLAQDQLKSREHSDRLEELRRRYEQDMLDSIHEMGREILTGLREVKEGQVAAAEVTVEAISQEIAAFRNDLRNDLIRIQEGHTQRLDTIIDEFEREKEYERAYEQIHRLVQKLIGDKSIIRYQEQLRDDHFGDRWAEFTADDQTFLATAEFLYQDNKDTPRFDFAPVAVEFCKVVETELQHKFVDQLKTYLHSVGHRSDLKAGRVNIEPNELHRMSLGDIQYLLRDTQAGHPANQVVREYAASKVPQMQTFLLQKLPDILQEVAKDYRNSSAHNAQLDRATLERFRAMLLGIGQESLAIKLLNLGGR